HLLPVAVITASVSVFIPCVLPKELIPDDLVPRFSRLGGLCLLPVLQHIPHVLYCLAEAAGIRRLFFFAVPGGLSGYLTPVRAYAPDLETAVLYLDEVDLGPLEAA